MRWVRLIWRRYCAGCLVSISAGDYALDMGGIVVHGERCAILHAQYKAKQPPT